MNFYEILKRQKSMIEKYCKPSKTATLTHSFRIITKRHLNLKFTKLSNKFIKYLYLINRLYSILISRF